MWGIVLLVLGIVLTAFGLAVMLASMINAAFTRASIALPFTIGSACASIGIGLIYWAGRLAA